MTRKIGALWRKRKDNKIYLTGQIEVIAGQPIAITILPNDRKAAGTNQPDYNILLTEKKEKQEKQVKIEKISEL